MKVEGEGQKFPLFHMRVLKQMRKVTHGTMIVEISDKTLCGGRAYEPDQVPPL